MKPFVLSVTGVPCSGKTTLSERLGPELGAKVINLNEFIEDEGLFTGYDEGRDTKIVDVKRLKSRLRGNLEGDVIIDGLLSHMLDVTHILVLRCDPRILAKRMRERKYSDRKIMENLEAEYSGAILYDSIAACENVFEADNSRGADIGRIMKWVRTGGETIVEKDWTFEFESVLGSSG